MMIKRHQGARWLACLALVTLNACGPAEEAPRDCAGQLIDPRRPANGAALVTWIAPLKRSDGAPLDGLYGFRINYGLDPDRLSCQVEIRDPTVTSWKITGLSPGTWYFAVVAVDLAFVESSWSNVVSKQVK